MKLFLRTFLLAMTTTIALYACDVSVQTAEDTKSSVKPVMAANAAEVITVMNPRIRSTAPGQTVSGAFMTLVNASSTPHALTAASFGDARMVEIHETSMNEGVMRMRKVKQIDIPANGSAELKPGGYHIMLMGIESQMKAGTTGVLTLTFSDDSRLTVEASITDLIK